MPSAVPSARPSSQMLSVCRSEATIAARIGSSPICLLKISMPQNALSRSVASISRRWCIGVLLCPPLLETNSRISAWLMLIALSSYLSLPSMQLEACVLVPPWAVSQKRLLAILLALRTAETCFPFSASALAKHQQQFSLLQSDLECSSSDVDIRQESVK